MSDPCAKVSSSLKKGECMSYIKRALEEILFCESCNGLGWTGWVSDELGDYSFEPCECNPHKLPSPERF